MVGANRIIGVELSVAGFAVVDENDLAKKLGHAPWVVWQMLTARRDRQGITHATIASMTKARGYEKFSHRTVKKALARLRKAGLVEHIRTKWERTPAGVSYRGVVRRIRGARQLSAVGAERVAVPDETKHWLSFACSKGGKRVGAGKKPGSFSSLPAGESKGAAGESKGAAGASQRSNQRGPHSTNTLRTSSEQLEKESTYVDPSPSPQAPPAHTSKEEIESAHGAALLGRSQRTPLQRSTPLKGLPAYPGWSVVAPALVPSPPLLVPTDPEDYKVRLLANAFRGAVEREYGVKCFLLANVTPKAKSYRALVEAALLLEGFGVAPAQWCCYAVRRWYLARTHSGGWTEGSPVPLPPINVIFSKKQITEKLSDREKLGAVTSQAQGGRAIFGTTHKALIVRYNEMRAAILRGHRYEEAMAMFLPGTSYEDMVDAAKNEAIDTRNRLDRDVSRGKIIW